MTAPMAAAVASTLPLDDQLEVLAELHTLPHGTNPRHHDYRGQCPCTSVEQLVSHLRQLGIEPTEAEQYDQLMSVRSPQPPELQPGDRLLDLAPSEYESRLRDYSFTAAVHEQWSFASARAREAIEAELRESMATEADDYADALRPAFEATFDIFREAADFGITPATTIEQAITLDPVAVAMWRLLASDLSASILNAILGVRIRLTTALRVDPGIDALADSGYAQVVDADRAAFDVNRGAGWQRWLAVAQASPAAHLTNGGL